MASHDSDRSRPHSRSLRNFESALLSKQGQVVANLATELLSRVPGDQTLRVQEYATLFDASAGTVQSALNYLQAASAARLEGRGRRGTVILELQYPLLWSLALNRPLIGIMPLPYTKHFEGLATGIRSQFSQHPIDLDLRFMRGATSRLQLLSSRECDWVVLSQFAAKTANAHGFEVEIVMALTPQTYMGRHILLLPASFTQLQDGMKVGIDLKSPDHTAVVRSISRGKQVKFIEIDYSQGLELTRAGMIDATVWSREDIPAEFDDLAFISLDAQAEPIIKQTSEAAIVVSRGNLQALHVLRATLNQADLYQIQQDIVQKLRLPSY
jgi:hypothetical protein